MLKTICSVLFIVSSFSLGLAQQDDARLVRSSAIPLVTAGASAERARFSAPSSVVQMRLQVYADNGQVVFDATSKGNVLDWTVQDGSGQRLQSGAYLCVVTVKSLSGKLMQRIGEVAVQEHDTQLRAMDQAQLTQAQRQEIGPVEEDSAIAIVKDREAEAATIVAHSGDEGQIVRGRGALSFRIGDFFSGNDKEQMRLTAEGNLGIGITHPTVRLEVDGLIRSTQGIVFPDGTIQYSASSRTLGAKSTRPDQMPNEKQDVQPQAAGTGTQNQIAKWTDNAGTLGDSVISELGGNIGIGTSAPAKRLHVANGQIALDNGRFLYSRRNGSAFYQEAFGIDSNNDIVFNRNSIVTGVDADAPKSPSGLIFGTGAGKFMDVRNSSNATLMRVQEATGNVGIGTTSPVTKLHVAGALRWGGAGSAPPYVYSDEDGSGLYLEQVGNSTPTSRMRLQSSVTGGQSDYSQFFIDPANGFSFVSDGAAKGSVGIGTTSPQATLDVRGDIRLGSTGQYRATSGEENLRLIRGSVSINGGIISGFGFSVVKLVEFPNSCCTGFTINFNTPFAGTPTVTATLVDDNAVYTATEIFVSQYGAPPSSSSVTLFMRTRYGCDECTPARAAFHFIAIGPR